MRPRRRRFVTQVTIASAALIVAMPHASAGAQPDDSSDAMERYQQLGAQAAQTEEDLSQAETDLAAKQQARDEATAAVATATAAVDQAQQAEGQFRGEMDRITGDLYRNGGQVVRWSAAFTSGSPEQFLDQMSALDLIAADNSEKLGQLAGVTTQAASAREAAAQAQQNADKAATDAETAVNTLKSKKADLDNQIQQVRDALNDLSPDERDELGTVQDNGIYLGPPGAANDALQAALGRRGSEYEWGATGPNEFDCSGLTSWAYKQAGITIPRTSRQQWTVGKPVSQDALQPGDLLFYDDGTGNPATIHHVGMYVGDGKMVDAPTEGQLVDVRSMRSDGHYIGARRIVG
ncbi:C40 family peptidase [Actinophytocola sp.]|uniref:C40 family peptidase n=1 Tax=Actinophytocola sp. TaxID=1872138 RepID=UPI002ED630FB